MKNFMQDYIIFSTADWNTPCWTNKQHIASHLQQLGLRVLYIESVGLRSPSVNRKDLRRILNRLLKSIRPPRLVKENIWVMSPFTFPFKHHWKMIRVINQKILAWQLHRFIKKQCFNNSIVWTYHPFMLETLKKISRKKLIYHCVDDLAAIPGINSAAFEREEKRLLLKSDTVFTTSKALFEKCHSHNANTYNFPNVVDVKHFRQARQAGAVPTELLAIPHPRIGYVGVLSYFKIDFELILTIAMQQPKWQWVLIGDEKEGQQDATTQKLQSLPNVHFLGHRPYSELPNYLRGLDVATLPSLLNKYTKAMFPMKYFEYLAAGLPIVATPLEFTHDHTAGIFVADNSVSFITGIKQQLSRGRLTDEEAEAFVGDNTWEIRLKRMFEAAGI